MDRGYVKLWRKTLDSGWLKNHKLWVFWSYCLMKASYKEREILVGNQKIKLLPGQFIFGRKSASKDCGMTERQIRTSVHYLERLQNVTIKTTNKFSIISIINWVTYQNEDIKNDQQNDQQHANKLPTNCQQHATNKNSKNIKNNIYTPDFEIFYKAYPNRKDKSDAWKAWSKRNGSLPPLQTILEAIENQIAWRANAKPGEFRPVWKNPSTWINKGSWEDEIEEVKKTVW
jgi:hypothetical protein